MIAFWVLAILLVLSAVFTVTAQKPVYSVIGLLVNFVGLAILYITLQAEFMAVIQIVVYSGAILILFLFVIALLSAGVKPFDVGPNRLPNALWPGIGLAVIVLALIDFGTLSAPYAPSHEGASSTLGRAGEANVFGSIHDFGAALFGPYLLPFEVTAFVLMVAVIGVILLASDAAPMRSRGHHRRGGKREPIAKRETEALR